MDFPASRGKSRRDLPVAVARDCRRNDPARRTIPGKDLEISSSVAAGLRNICTLFPAGVIWRKALPPPPASALLKTIPALRSAKQLPRNPRGGVKRRFLDPALG